MKKNLILPVLFALSVLLLNGCKEKEPTFDNLSLNPTTLSMKVGETLSVTIPTGSGEYTAASNNQSVATALLSGKTLTVTAKSKGDAVMTVTDKITKQTAQVKVSVTEPPKIILTTTKTIGEQIGLYVKANESDKADCWIDLNNNGIKEEGEAVKTFNEYVSYPLGVQTITLHGKVTELYCSFNELTSLDVTKNTALTTLKCRQNQLTALVVSKNTALTTLDCYFNELTALDVTNNTALTELNCSNNQLNALDVTKNTALTTLECRKNLLTALDVSKNTALTELNCTFNQLNALDVNNGALEYLVCNHNELTALDVSKNTALRTLECGINQLNQEAVIKLFSDLPNRQGVADGTLILIWKPDANYEPTPEEIKVARDKNWTVNIY